MIVQRLEAVRPEVEIIALERGRTITRERSAATQAQQSAEAAYSPQVSTWGVFDRPRDISAAFGGGRNLTPGAPLESPEAAAAREASVKEKLAALRETQGLDVSELDAGQIASLLAEGDAAFAGGRLERAAAAYRRCAALAPLRSEPGGTARLQLAVCLDSLGGSEGQNEAKDLYTALSRHPNNQTAKQAKRLLFGMTDATAFLKADTIDYLAQSGVRDSYRVYLQSQVSLDVFAASPEAQAEAEALNRLSYVAVACLLALPTGLLLGLRSVAEAHRATAH